MRDNKRKALPALFLVLLLPILLTSCWDEHELDRLFIVTGIALDKSNNDDQMDITLQVGKTQATFSGSDEVSSVEDPILLLKTTSDTIRGGLNEFNRNGGYSLMMSHNQVLLVGSELAEQGIRRRLDLFIRDQQARIEVPLVIVDGRAETALSAKLLQENITGIFLDNVFKDLFNISKNYEVRLVDFISRLLDETTVPVVPIIDIVKVKESKGEEVKISGMAVFRDDKMIGRLSNDKVLGYIWTMGNVKQSNVRTSNSQGKAVFYIDQLDCKKKITLRKDGGVGINLYTNASITVSELSGFGNIPQEQLIPVLKQMAQDEIKKKITDTLNTVCKMEADIYGFGKLVHSQYPKQWKKMKPQWNTLFSNIDFNVEVNVRLPSVGKTLQPLEMGGQYEH